MIVKIVKSKESIELPKYQSKMAAGVDLRASLDYNIYPMDTQLVSTGISVKIPEGYEGQVRSRSGLALKGIHVLNSPGTIDADYTGEIKVILRNDSAVHFRIKQGDRIAQLVFSPIIQVEFLEVSKLEDTDRGSNGFGSTGSD